MSVLAPHHFETTPALAQNGKMMRLRLRPLLCGISRTKIKNVYILMRFRLQQGKRCGSLKLRLLNSAFITMKV
jgi:hypothetical protein